MHVFLPWKEPHASQADSLRRFGQHACIRRSHRRSPTDGTGSPRACFVLVHDWRRTNEPHCNSLHGFRASRVPFVFRGRLEIVRSRLVYGGSTKIRRHHSGRAGARARSVLFISTLPASLQGSPTHKRNYIAGEGLAGNTRPVHVGVPVAGRQHDACSCQSRPKPAHRGILRRIRRDIFGKKQTKGCTGYAGKSNPLNLLNFLNLSMLLRIVFFFVFPTK